LTIRAVVTRAREAGRRDAARPARSAWSVQRQLTARFDGEVAGGAVADPFLVIFRFGATMELGRSGRSMMMMTSASASGGDGGLATSPFCSRAFWLAAALEQALASHLRARDRQVQISQPSWPIIYTRQRGLCRRQRLCRNSAPQRKRSYCTLAGLWVNPDKRQLIEPFFRRWHIFG
jgi:hypothetical protein